MIVVGCMNGGCMSRIIHNSSERREGIAISIVNIPIHIVIVIVIVIVILILIIIIVNVIGFIIDISIVGMVEFGREKRRR